MVKNSELDYIPLFLDFYERYAGLTYEERGRLVWGMLAYARNEDPDPHLTEDLKRLVFPNEKGMIDRTRKKHEARTEQRSAAAKARWHPNDGTAMQIHTNACITITITITINKGSTRTHAGGRTGPADARSVGQETILLTGNGGAVNGRADGGGEATGSLQPGPGACRKAADFLSRPSHPPEVAIVNGKYIVVYCTILARAASRVALTRDRIRIIRGISLPFFQPSIIGISKGLPQYDSFLSF